MVKVKEVEQDIMSSSLGELVLKEEEREWRRRKEEEERRLELRGGEGGRKGRGDGRQPGRGE